MRDLLFVLLGVVLGMGALLAERIAVQRMGVRRAVRAAVKYQKELKGGSDMEDATFAGQQELTPIVLDKLLDEKLQSPYRTGNICVRS